MNKGYTMIEVAENLKLPPSLAQEWFNRDYYGTVNHNAKAVYQKYIGWYDGKPFPAADATLNLTRATLDDVNTGVLTWQGAILSGKIQIAGNPTKLFDLLGLLNITFDPMFNIVTP